MPKKIRKNVPRSNKNTLPSVLLHAVAISPSALQLARRISRAQTESFKRTLPDCWEPATPSDALRGAFGVGLAWLAFEATGIYDAWNPERLPGGSTEKVPVAVRRLVEMATAVNGVSELTFARYVHALPLAGECLDMCASIATTRGASGPAGVRDVAGDALAAGLHFAALEWLGDREAWGKVQSLSAGSSTEALEEAERVNRAAASIEDIATERAEAYHRATSSEQEAADNG